MFASLPWIFMFLLLYTSTCSGNEGEDYDYDLDDELLEDEQQEGRSEIDHASGEDNPTSRKERPMNAFLTHLEGDTDDFLQNVVKRNTTNISNNTINQTTTKPPDKKTETVRNIIKTATTPSSSVNTAAKSSDRNGMETTLQHGDSEHISKKRPTVSKKGQHRVQKLQSIKGHGLRHGISGKNEQKNVDAVHHNSTLRKINQSNQKAKRRYGSKKITKPVVKNALAHKQKSNINSIKKQDTRGSRLNVQQNTLGQVKHNSMKTQNKLDHSAKKLRQQINKYLHTSKVFKSLSNKKKLSTNYKGKSKIEGNGDQRGITKTKNVSKSSKKLATNLNKQAYSGIGGNSCPIADLKAQFQGKLKRLEKKFKTLIKKISSKKRNNKKQPLTASKKSKIKVIKLVQSPNGRRRASVKKSKRKDVKFVKKKNGNPVRKAELVQNKKTITKCKNGKTCNKLNTDVEKVQQLPSNRSNLRSNVKTGDFVKTQRGNVLSKKRINPTSRRHFEKGHRRSTKGLTKKSSKNSPRKKWKRAKNKIHNEVFGLVKYLEKLKSQLSHKYGKSVDKERVRRLGMIVD